MTTKTLSKKAQKEQDRQEALTKLREWLPEGTTVYTVIRSVAKSGMSRRLDLYFVGPDGKLWYLSGYAAKVLDIKRDRKDGLRVDGCGMDMGFATVYNLSVALYGHAESRTCKFNHQWI